MKYEFSQTEIDKSVKAIRAFTNSVNLEIVKMFEGHDILSRKEIEKKLNMVVLESPSVHPVAHQRIHGIAVVYGIQNVTIITKNKYSKQTADNNTHEQSLFCLF